MSSIDASRRAKGSVVFYILWVLPFLAVLAFIYRYGVDVPYWDEFDSDMAGLLTRFFVGGGVTWHALIAQHNETRPLCIRLFYLASMCLGPWDTRWAMVGTAITILITSAAVLWLAVRTMPNRGAAICAALLADYLLFSAVQWNNLLWGIQWIVFVPAAALAVSLALLESEGSFLLGRDPTAEPEALGRSRPARRFIASVAVAAVAAVISTFSYANGMVVWVLVVPALVFHKDRRRGYALLVWLVLAGLCIGYYFHDYVKPAGHPAMTIVLHLPGYAVQFFLAFLGNGLRYNDDVRVDMVLGGMAVIFWLWAVTMVLMRQDAARLRRAMPWIILGSYSLISAATTTAGRLGYGVMTANSARYCTFAIPLWISIVPLWFVACDRKKNEGGPWGITIMAGAIGLIALHGVVFVQGELGGWVAARCAARSVIQFASVTPDLGDIGELVFPDPVKTAALLAEMNSHHLLHCGSVVSDNVLDLSGGAIEHGGGNMECLTQGDGMFMVGGWAEDPERKTVPDAILLTIRDRDGAQTVWGIATDDRLRRGDVATVTHHRWLKYSGWEYLFGPDRIPAGSTILAWAYDSSHKRAYQLAPGGGLRWPPR